MTSICRRFSKLFGCTAVLASALFGPLPSLWAQGPVPDAPVPSTQPTVMQLAVIQPAATRPATTMFTTTSIPSSEHKFWDRENAALFAASASLTAADFAVTRANLQSGGHELNPVVRIFGRSTAGLAVNFAGETAGVIGLSYFFHMTGHHRLERLVSVVNMGASAGAVSYGMAHR
jgi:hypothetical protein